MTQGHCFQGPHVQLLSATLRAPMGAAWKGSSIIHHFWGQNGVREKMVPELEQNQPWHSWDLGQELFTGVTSDASMAAEAARNMSPAFLQRGHATNLALPGYPGVQGVALPSPSVHALISWQCPIPPLLPGGRRAAGLGIPCIPTNPFSSSSSKALLELGQRSRPGVGVLGCLCRAAVGFPDP